MPGTATVHANEGDLGTLTALCAEVRDGLLRAKHAIDEEIRSYPTPIPRCDAQFNHLYEQRGRLVRELERIAANSENGLRREDYIRLLRDFISSVRYTDDDEEKRLRARIEKKLAAFVP